MGAYLIACVPQSVLPNSRAEQAVILCKYTDNPDCLARVSSKFYNGGTRPHSAAVCNCSGKSKVVKRGSRITKTSLYQTKSDV